MDELDSFDEFDSLANDYCDYEELKDFCSDEILRDIGLNPQDFEQEQPPAKLREAIPCPDKFGEVFEKEPTPQFGKSITDEELDGAIKGRIPRNTKRSTTWGLRVWESWCSERRVKKDILQMSCAELDDYIARFVQEAVKKDGKEPYPPNSLYQIAASLQRHLRESGRVEVSFFDEHSPVFSTLRRSLDARMKELTSKGIGTNTRSADPISPEMEAVLWEEGIFSASTGEGLMNAVYWYNCKLFGLRAGDEHRNLEVEQFKFGSDQQGEYVVFNGRSSKNYQGGLKHRKLSAKELKIYSIPELGERDMVSCFKKYLSLIPNKGPFYRRPVRSAALQFSTSVVGKNTLGNLVQKFCEKAKFSGRFTGHSGKVTCATELFKNDVDEQLIQLQTGHRSDAVRAYKRPGDAHFRRVSEILQPPPPKRVKVGGENALKEKQVSQFMGKRTPLTPMQVPAGMFSAPYGNITLNFNFGSAK